MPEENTTDVVVEKVVSPETPPSPEKTTPPEKSQPQAKTMPQEKDTSTKALPIRQIIIETDGNTINLTKAEVVGRIELVAILQNVIQFVNSQK